jgi:hypothetical protein
METESSLPCQQNPASFPYPEPDQLNPRFLFFLNIHFNIILPFSLRFYCLLFICSVFSNVVNNSACVRSVARCDSQ